MNTYEMITFSEAAKYVGLHLYSLNLITKKQQLDMDNLVIESGYPFLIYFLNSLDAINISTFETSTTIDKRTICYVTIKVYDNKNTISKTKYTSIW